MRRLLLVAAGLAALTLTVPAAALASHGHRHHHKHKTKQHHGKVRFEHLGGGSGTTGTGVGTGTNPPTTSTPPAPTENAGKVASYTGGVLTLTLGDGSSVSGKVTGATRIECVSATPTPPPTGPEDGETPGDDNGMGGDQSQGDQQPPAPAAGSPLGVHGEDGQNGGGDDQGDEGQQGGSEPPCDSSALVAGAIVRQAELRIGPGGTEFESIELLR